MKKELTNEELMKQRYEVYKQTGIYNNQGLFDNTKIINKDDDKPLDKTILDDVKQIDKPTIMRNIYKQTI